MIQNIPIGKNIHLLVAFIFLHFYNISFSQSMDLYKMFTSKNGDLNYLAPYMALENDTLDFPLKIHYQLHYNAYLHQFDDIKKSLNRKSKVTNPDIILKDARQEILNRALSSKIIMFNEEHYNPAHRLYVETYLKDLKKQGFTVLALETLNWEDTVLNERKYPTSTSGTYTREPYFANLVRSALRLGYKVLPYENKDTLDRGIKNREKNQAYNLSRILHKESGKVLVLGGGMHISETPIESGHHKGDLNEWMAYLLKKQYDIDPLTIDQTEIKRSSRANTVSLPYMDDELYTSQRFKGIYDLTLIYPTTHEYLHIELGKRRIEVVCNQENSKNKLLQFYIREEFEKHKNQAIPYEQFLINTPKTNIYLSPENEYIMIIRDTGYKITTQKVITKLGQIDTITI